MKDHNVDREQYLRERVIPAVLGACIGDALGVPVEFKSREYLMGNPVEIMQGYGTYNQPSGTWSDDSSLTFALMESLINGFDIEDIAAKMALYLDEAYWTPYDNVFDIGNITRVAIEKFKKGVPPLLCGGEDAFDNGNGSLMRIMPLAFFLEKEAEFDLKIKLTEQVSSITHRHPRSIAACLLYIEFMQNLATNRDKKTAYEETVKTIKEQLMIDPYKDEMTYFERILSGRLQEYSVDEIKSTGYVIDSLEACLWCFLTSESYKEAVLKAVNLGGDTDTIGFLAGSLSGVYYKMDQIPEGWINALARKQDVVELCERFINSQLR